MTPIASRTSAFVGALAALELLQQFLDADSTLHRIAVDAPGDVLARMVVDAQDRIASVRFTEAFVGLVPVERVDEDRNEAGRGG